MVAGTFSYLVNARETTEITKLVEEITINIPNYKDDIMTYAEELLQKGKQEAEHEIAKNLLKSGVDSSIITKATHLTMKQLEELKKTIS